MHSSMDYAFTTMEQALLVQDGKLYGREPIIDVICKAARLPERVKCHAIMKNKTVEKLGEVNYLMSF